MKPSHRSNRLRILTAIVFAVLLALQPAASAAPAPSETADTRTITLIHEEAALFELLLEMRQWIQEYSIVDISLEDLYEGAAAGMVDALGDPYSEYLDGEEYKNLTSSMDGEYVGIGVVIDSVNGEVVVRSTFRGSPAEKAGIMAGDVIMAADGKDLRAASLLEVQSTLRGDRGTSVKITVRRPATGAVMEFTVTRDLINQYPLDVRDLGGNIYYIGIPQFTAKAASDFSVIMRYLRSIAIKGLILDLRGNPGGLVESSLSIASELIPKGPVVELRGKAMSQTLEIYTDPPSLYPVVVLVNKGSASASEILAGAIRDRGVGILVGEPTFGKASVQAVVPVGNAGAGLRLTIADYYTPSGYSLADRGLDPDILIEPNKTDAPQPLEFKRPMRPGLVGLDVLALQECLAFLGYKVGEPDGVFGNVTLAAASAFLADRGSSWQGSFGAGDVEKLNAAVAEHVRNQPDVVLEAGIAALRARLETHHWPLPIPPKI